MERIVTPAGGDQGWLCGGGGTKLDIEVYYLTVKFLSPFIFKPLTASEFFWVLLSYSFCWLIPFFCEGSLEIFLDPFGAIEGHT